MKIIDNPYSIGTVTVIPDASDAPGYPETPKQCREENPQFLVDGVVIPQMRVLLASILGTVDASLPNKDQNRAVKHIVRTNFDAAYFSILRGFFPLHNFANGPGYALTPEPDKVKAMEETLYQK